MDHFFDHTIRAKIVTLSDYEKVIMNLSNRKQLFLGLLPLFGC